MMTAQEQTTLLFQSLRRRIRVIAPHQLIRITWEKRLRNINRKTEDDRGNPIIAMLYFACGDRASLPACGKTASLLTASNINPVIHCNEEEMSDPYNGLLLTTAYDKLFDRGFISFNDDGTIVISEMLPAPDAFSLGLKPDICIKLDSRHLPYLQFHRDKILQKRRSAR